MSLLKCVKKNDENIVKQTQKEGIIVKARLGGGLKRYTYSRNILIQIKLILY